MCRIGAIKSKKYIHPSLGLRLMRSQQEGHDNSGFAFVAQDLGGIFEDYKELPTLSMAATLEGARRAEDVLHKFGFVRVFQWTPEKFPSEELEITPMPNYLFETFDYPRSHKYATKEEKEELLLEVYLKLRKELEVDEQGYVYSFWPDVLTLKEIGNPKDIGTYFGLWDDNSDISAKIITAQCRQNTNYDIVRYAAHPFFLEGYTVLANGENTFYEKNKHLQQTLYKAYMGFESDSQCFLYSLHYVNKILKWPIKYFKHTITPLSYEQIIEREDKEVLLRMKASLANLEINGPNTILGVLPEGDMICVCDSKKLRPIVIGQDKNMVIMTSEVAGLNDIMPDRDSTKDIYPTEKETIIVDKNLRITRCPQ